MWLAGLPLAKSECESNDSRTHLIRANTKVVSVSGGW